MLDPEQESAEVNYFNLQPDDIPQLRDQNHNLTRVLLGEYHGIRATRKISHNVSYLDVHLKAGESWSFSPSEKQVRGFVYPRSGAIDICGTTVKTQQLALLKEDQSELVITAEQDAQFVVAMTEPWPHKIVQYSVQNDGQIHTSQAALQEGSEHIEKLKLALIEKLNQRAFVS